MAFIAHSRFFSRRSYTFKLFFRDIGRVIGNLGSIHKTMQHASITPRFAEHVMLAVTAVNGCRYCSYVHARMALEAGCSVKEIAKLLTSNGSEIPVDEAIAIAFAHHYADSGGNPERFALVRLMKTYGLQKSRDIVNFTYMITIGNYMGNTIDAFRSRLNGIPPELGSPLMEFIVYVIGTLVVKVLGITHAMGTLDVHAHQA